MKTEITSHLQNYTAFEMDKNYRITDVAQLVALCEYIQCQNQLTLEDLLHKCLAENTRGAKIEH